MSIFTERLFQKNLSSPFLRTNRFARYHLGHYENHKDRKCTFSLPVLYCAKCARRWINNAYKNIKKKSLISLLSYPRLLGEGKMRCRRNKPHFLREEE